MVLFFLAFYHNAYRHFVFRIDILLLVCIFVLYKLTKIFIGEGLT